MNFKYRQQPDAPCAGWNQRALFLALGVLSVLSLGGCTLWSAMEEDRASDTPDFQKPEARQIVLTPEPTARDLTDFLHPAVLDSQSVYVHSLAIEPPPDSYVIGPTDVLYIDVFGQPGMGSPRVSGEDKILGSRVDGRGQVQLPLIGRVQVGGLTTAQAQQKLQRLYGKLIAEPWVVVEVVRHRSQPLYLVGQFDQSGVHYMDRPTTLMQAVALGRVTDEADLRGARLIRGRRTMPVDIYSLLKEGAIEQNVWLKPEDTVFIPDKRDQQVFVLGDVGVPGPVPMINGYLTLSQALAAAGNFKRTGSDLERVRIIRSKSTTQGELIVVDLQRILRGDALPYALIPGDVVYIPRDQLGDWNDSIRELIPTLSLVSNLLSPFVQIKFLSD